MNTRKSFTGFAVLFIAVFTVSLITSCTKENPQDQYNPPADHTISKSGYMHKTGLNAPLDNCTTCHGADLKGGTVGVSCFQCHGIKW